MATDAIHLHGLALGRPWQHISATDVLTRFDSSSEQATSTIKLAMSYTQLCGNHVLKFFGSDGREEEKFLRL